MRHLRAWATGAVLVVGCGGSAMSARIADTGAAAGTVSVSVRGPGEVTAAGGACNASAGAACSLAVPQGSTVALEATPAPGAVFTGWSGACSGTGVCTLQPGQNVSASFTAAPDCAGLVPVSLPKPVTVAQPQGLSGGCGGGTSDGMGNFALAFTAGGVSTYPAYAFFDARGNELGQRNFGSDQGYVRYFAQPSGFSELLTNETAGARQLNFWSHDGAQRGSALLNSSNDPRPSFAAAAADPAGGTVAAISRKDAASSTWANSIVRYDAQGAVVSSAAIDGSETKTVTALGVDDQGNALVFASDGSAPVARWFGSSGAPLTAWFSAPDVTEVTLLADGALVARAGRPASAVAVYRKGDTSSEPVPQWLQDRAQNRLFAVRGGYASWGSGGSCGGALELLSAAGRSCGCVPVPSLDAYASAGRDGSLIVAAQDGATCHYELYPQLLK